MAEPAPQTEIHGEKTTQEDRNFHDVLLSLIGKVVTCINPESYEAAPLGYQIKAGFYRGKVTGVGKDYLIMMTEMSTRKKEERVPVKQYIPLNHVKRISLTKAECMLHL